MITRLLSGIAVLDFTSIGPGPRCARLLADHGARVVRVVPARSAPQIDVPSWIYSGGREIWEIGVDLKDPRGIEVIHSMLPRFDVALEAFRPGVADRLGIGYDALRHVRPNLVYASVSGFGRTGRYSNWAAHDLNWLGLGGYLALSGMDADGLPALPGSTIADGAGGWAATSAILAALVRRGLTGEGGHVDVSVIDAVLRQTYVHVDQYLATRRAPAAGVDELNGGSAHYGVYRCGDGGCVTVAAIEPKFFANLCRLLDLEHLVPHQHDAARQQEIREAFAERFAGRSRDEWVEILGPGDACVGPVFSVEEVAERYLTDRALVWDVRQGACGRVEQVAPILLGGEPPDRAEIELPHPTSTAELLTELGVAPPTAQELITAGVLR